MKAEIAYSLALRLKSVFDNPRSVMEMPVLDSGGHPAGQVVMNPAGGEDYNDAVSDFIATGVAELVDYRLLIDARKKWCGWARFLSWAILSLLLTEAAMAGLLFVLKFLEYVPAKPWLIVTFAPTAAGLVGCLLPLGFLLYFHDRITGIREHYGSF